VETSASTDGSSSAMPHVIIGGSAVSILSAASEDNKPTLGYSWSAGIVKAITSSSATSGALTYTGVKGETADETAKRINAILKLQGGLTSDVSVDSGSTSPTSSTCASARSSHAGRSIIRTPRVCSTCRA
jgi:hypothetical protein